EELWETTEQAIAEVDQPEEKLRRFIQAHAGYIADNYTFYTAANFGFAGLSASQGRVRVVKLRDRHERNLRAVLEEGRKAGVFDVGDLGVTSRALLSTLTGLARWYRPT